MPATTAKQATSASTARSKRAADASTRKASAPKKKAPTPAQQKAARKKAALEKQQRAFEERMRSSGVHFDDWARLVGQLVLASSEPEAEALYASSRDWPFPFAFLELAGKDEGEGDRIVAAVKAMNDALDRKQRELAARGESWSVLGSLGDVLNDS